MQNDLDCFLLACNHGQLNVIQELVNVYHMDSHIANKVCTHVCVRGMGVCM